MKFFEVKTKRLSVNDSNLYETVKEQWLVEASTFTEAEANTLAYIKSLYPKDDVVFTGIKPSKIEVVLDSIKSGSIDKNVEVPEDDDRHFYKCTVLMSGEGHGKRGEKFFICAKADGVDSANDLAVDYTRGEDLSESTEISSIKIEKTGFLNAIFKNE